MVGGDLHPLGNVKHFAPYVAKIKAANADTVITGNWGNDLSLLIRASHESGLGVDYYTTGLGFRTDRKIEPRDTLLPNRCRMIRP